MKKHQPKNVIIEPLLEKSEAGKKATACGVSTTTGSAEREKNYRKGKQTLAIKPKKGETMDTCATISDKYICCNVKVLKSVSNCPFDCSYCFLQNYLNDGTTSVIGDIPAMMDEVKEKTSKQPWRFFRIGTWELGDSLALEHLSGQAKLLIEAFKDIPNAMLELKTKSDNVDGILKCDHQLKTVVSWSMNTEHIINEQEHKTARLHERLTAIEKVAKAGYLMGFHFDPMIYYKEWKSGYTSLIKDIFTRVDPKQVAWISIGSLRFNPEMKNKMDQNFPKNTLTSAEMVLGDDGKMRYVKPLRIEMYDHIYRELNKYITKTNLVYLCMERWDVWEKILGYTPKSIGDLDYIFAKTLRDNYPKLSVPEPDKELYIKYQHT